MAVKNTAIHYLTLWSSAARAISSLRALGETLPSLGLAAGAPGFPWLWLGGHSTPLSASTFTLPSPLGLCHLVSRSHGTGCWARQGHQG